MMFASDNAGPGHQNSPPLSPAPVNAVEVSAFTHPRPLNIMGFQMLAPTSTPASTRLPTATP